jgi:hypothetical protein
VGLFEGVGPVGATAGEGDCLGAGGQGLQKLVGEKSVVLRGNEVVPSSLAPAAAIILVPSSRRLWPKA